jgi:tetratricopeptide (TPR) repeat protein
MTKRLLLAALFIPFIGNAQKPVYNFKQAEADIQKIIFSNPDGALTIIKKTLSQGKLHDSIYASTYNLYGLYHTMKGNQDSSLYYYKKAVNYGKDYHRVKAGIIINLTAAYRRAGDYDNSIKLITQSLKEYDNKEDNTVRAMLYGELASNYTQKLEHKKAVEYLLQAMDILRAEGQYGKLPALRQRLANTYLSMKNYAFAADMYEECLKDFKTDGSEKNYNLTLVNLAEAQIFLRRYKEAKASLTKAIAGLEKFGDIELIGMSYSKIGNLEFEMGNYSSASANYQKAIDLLLKTNSSRIIRISGDYINLLNKGKEYQKALGIIKLIEKHKINEGENLEDRMIYKDAVADTYNATNNDKLAADAYEQAVALRDSISVNEQENAVHEIQAKYQTQKQRDKNIALKNHNNLLQEKIKTEKTMLLLYIAITAVILIVISLWLRGTRLRNRLQKEELKAIESEKKRIEQQHQYEKELKRTQH